MKRKIYVLGSLNNDLVIYVDKLPKPGETIFGKNFMTNVGGKGGNQAVAASMLEENVFMISAVGDDYYSENLVKQLNLKGVNTKYIKALKNQKSGTALIVSSLDDNQIIVDKGANDLVDYKDFFENEKINEQDILIVQYEIPIKIANEGLKIAKSKNMITILNPAPAVKLDDEIYQYVDYLILNQSESEIIFEIYPEKNQDFDKIIEIMKQKTIKNVLITLGSKGALLIENNNKFYQEAFKITPIDTTGAGDAFIGAFAYGISNNLSPQEKLKFANATSALACLKKGAMQAMPKLEEVKKFMKEK